MIERLVGYYGWLWLVYTFSSNTRSLIFLRWLTLDHHEAMWSFELGFVGFSLSVCPLGLFDSSNILYIASLLPCVLKVALWVCEWNKQRCAQYLFCMERHLVGLRFLFLDNYISMNINYLILSLKNKITWKIICFFSIVLAVIQSYQELCNRIPALAVAKFIAWTLYSNQVVIYIRFNYYSLV